jgi:hypothetical protein
LWDECRMAGAMLWRLGKDRLLLSNRIPCHKNRIIILIVKFYHCGTLISEYQFPPDCYTYFSIGNWIPTVKMLACSYLSSAESYFIYQNLQLLKSVECLSVKPENLPCPRKKVNHTTSWCVYGTLPYHVLTVDLCVTMFLRWMSMYVHAQPPWHVFALIIGNTFDPSTPAESGTAADTGLLLTT